MTSARASEISGETFVGQVCLVLLPHAVEISSSGSTLASLLGCWSVLFTQTLAMSDGEWLESDPGTSGFCGLGCHKTATALCGFGEPRHPAAAVERLWLKSMETESNADHAPVAPLPTHDLVSLNDRFVSAYNEIDELMRKLTGLKKDFGFTAVLVEFERKMPLGADGDFLRSAADLRNVLIHRRTLPYLEMATPTDTVVLKMEAIRERMADPPKVYPRFQKQVAAVAPDDSLEDVMRMVSDLDFSQFPVMDGNRFIGLLTENGITRWLAGKIVDSMSLVDFADARVSDLVGSEESRKNFMFVPRRMSIAEAREMFRGNGLLEAVFITEKGRNGEKLLGLINRWDLAEE